MAQALLGGLGPLQIRAMQEQQLAQYLAPKGGGRILAAGSPGAGRDMGSQIGSGLAGLGAGLEKLGAYMDRNKAKEEQAAALEKRQALFEKARAGIPEKDRPMFDAAVAANPDAVFKAFSDRLFPKPGEGVTLGPGQRRYDANGNLVAEVPAAPKPLEQQNIVNPRTGEFRTITKGDPVPVGFVLGGNYTPEKPDNLTARVKEYELAKKEGFKGTFQEWMVLMANANAPRNEGTIPPGYRAERDEMGRVVNLVPIPGSKEAQEAEAAEQKTKTRDETQAAFASIVNDDVNRVLAMVQNDPQITTGLFGTALANIPGSPAADVANTLGSLKSAIARDTVQQMRNNSPTGGALGQVSDRDIMMLETAYGSILQSNSAELLTYNLKRFYDIYNDIVFGKGNGPKRFGGSAQSGNAGSSSGDKPKTPPPPPGFFVVQ